MVRKYWLITATVDYLDNILSLQIKKSTPPNVVGSAGQANNKLGNKKNQKSGLSIPKAVFFAVPQRLPEIKSNAVQRKKKSLISWKNEEEIQKINYKGKK